MRILDLFFPPRCVLCHSFLQSSRETICSDCSKWILHQKPIVKKLRYLDWAAAPLAYEEPVRGSIHRFKFGGREPYAAVYAEWIAACVQSRDTAFDLVTFAPVSRQRKRRRGYDQAELLCREISGLLNLPYARTLEKTRNNPKQSQAASVQSRRANVLGVYRAVDASRFSGKSILLIDDVITTGATAEECARVLLTAGASSVCCAAIAAVK